MKVVNDFSGEYYFLNNFANCKFRFEGIEWSSSECAFQAMKVLDLEERLKISKMDAGESKCYGRKVKLRPDWEEVKDCMMYKIVFAKFVQNENLRSLLLSVPEDTIFIEGNNWHDNYWGSCWCKFCNSTGQNKLGEILMQIRKII